MKSLHGWVEIRHAGCLLGNKKLAFRPEWWSSSSARLFSTKREKTAENGIKKDSEVQTFKIKTGSAGSITIDLYNSHLLTNIRSPLYIYIPPVGHHLRDAHASLPSFLPSTPKAIARINYRWNHLPPPPKKTSKDSSSSPSPPPAILTSDPSYANHPFPTPLHDTLYGFEFLTNTVLKSYTPKTPPSIPAERKSSFSPESAYYTPPSSKKPLPRRPLIICSSYLGGSLATSLALTESKVSKTLPYYIAGLIIENGVYDWTPIATSRPPKPHPSQHPSTKAPFKPWTASHLHKLKTHLFNSPESPFDAFVSPVLFFRTPGHHAPKTWPSNPSSPEPKNTTLLPNDEYLHYSTQTDSADHLDDDESYDIIPENLDPLSKPGITTTTLSLGPAPRKSPLRFPAKHSDIKLPRSLFLYSPAASNTPVVKNGKRKKANGEERELELDDYVTPQEQAEEMAGLMRRSVQLHELGERKMWDEELDVEVESADRVRVVEIGEGVRGEVEEWIEEEGLGG
ncbi:hypothetical protein GLAREA_01406 [Glarea lozoyensis ATCC 20868]|uniref:Alpha/beta-Hydrolase n=1 Tax=Glarea lozoyensis (strain ATCC 20868 / MF5171) TaxID=1116229 RepID=S3CJT0_GLAL2|nr:uncharacterized protein GLAREA_01406 [Glarea lozoyensis ATCC 20868]EPE25494.1 hypothetical protein GLAREA_01406 [Glarea lozoyensis ATCC 20868]